jgi:hypothetical protein
VVASHRFNTKESQSAAASEGIASFYAAMAFNNDTTETDCEIQKADRDWDLDGTRGEASHDPEVFSCETSFSLGAGASPESSVVGGDYLGSECIASGYSNNRATQFDYLRAFWDLRTGQSISFPTIVALWDHDPTAGTPQDTRTTPTTRRSGSSTPPTMPRSTS